MLRLTCLLTVTFRVPSILRTSIFDPSTLFHVVHASLQRCLFVLAAACNPG